MFFTGILSKEGICPSTGAMQGGGGTEGSWARLQLCESFPGTHPDVCSPSEVTLSWCVEERTDVMQITLELRLLWKPIKHCARLGNCPSPPGTDLVSNAARSHFGDKYSVVWTKQEKLLYSPPRLPTRKDTESTESHTSCGRTESAFKAEGTQLTSRWCKKIHLMHSVQLTHLFISKITGKWETIVTEALNPCSSFHCIIHSSSLVLLSLKTQITCLVSSCIFYLKRH